MQEPEINLKTFFNKLSFKSLRGYSIGILHNGRSSFFSDGLTSLENGILISKTTRFHIASLTKRFTAELFEIAEKQRHVSKDMLLEDFIPHPYLSHEKITLKHLLEHRSGIRDQWELAEFSGIKAGELITNETVLKQFQKQKSLNFTPGSYYLYCNTGYTLLAIILEEVMGKSIDELIAIYFSLPNRLENTGYYNYSETGQKNIAMAYSATGDEDLKLSIPRFAVIGSTSMYSSAYDLIALEKSFYQHKENLYSYAGYFDPTYHKGMINVIWSGTHLQLHSGWDYGYSSFLFRVPEKNLSIVLLSNYGTPNLFGRILEIAAVIEPDLLKTGEININIGSEHNHKIKNLSPGFFFNQASNLVSEIQDKGKGLTYEGSELLSIDGREAILKNSLNHIQPEKDDRFILKVLDSKLLFTPLISSQGNPLIQYSGKYSSDELDVTYQVIQTGNSLQLIIDDATHNLFFIDGIHYKTRHFSVKFLIEGNEVKSMLISNFRAWNMNFTKVIY